MAQDRPRKVVVALDTSYCGKQVLDFYIKNIWRETDYVVGVTVVEYDMASLSATGGADPVQISKLFGEKYKEYEKVTADYAADLRRNNVKGACDVANGKPGVVICDFAARHNAKLIVMGTRGLSKLKRAFLGSVSNYVLNAAGLPVVIVPTGGN